MNAVERPTESTVVDGHDLFKTVLQLRGNARDAALEAMALGDDRAPFVTRWVTVSWRARLAEHHEVRVTAEVSPDYVAVGEDESYVRVPLRPRAAQRLADSLDCLLPTPRMVDAIYAAAPVKLAAHPMTVRDRSSTACILCHNALVTRDQAYTPTGVLVAGHKKDVVICKALARSPGRVAIYGWHGEEGHRIQPLSLVHSESYLDYSHGVRLVRRAGWIDGDAVDFADVLGNPTLAPALSGEGALRMTGYGR